MEAKRVQKRDIEISKHELSRVKGRLHTLLRKEKQKIRSLNSSASSFKESSRLTEAGRTRSKERSVNQFDRSVRHGEHRDSPNKSKTSQQFQDNLQQKREQCNLRRVIHRGILEQVMAKSVKAKHQKAESTRLMSRDNQSTLRKRQAEEKLRVVHNVLKTKISEIASQQAAKQRTLLRKRDVSSRLQKDREKKEAELSNNRDLLCYSLDIEGVLQSNLETSCEIERAYSHLREKESGRSENSVKLNSKLPPLKIPKPKPIFPKQVRRKSIDRAKYLSADFRGI